MGFDKFDLFMLLSPKKFNENEAWLNREINFRLLEESFTCNSPELKHSAFVIGNNFQPVDCSEEDENAPSKIWVMFDLSDAAAAILIPGLSLAHRLKLVLDETLFYRQQLGLDTMSLEHLAVNAHLQTLRPCRRLFGRGLL